MSPSHAHGWRPGNATFWEEYGDLAFVVANSVILLSVFSVGIAANAFVILAVCRQKSLQTSTNALVVNLAVIDVLRCLIDCPVLLTIVITAYQRGRADPLLCDAQVASFSFSCCIQLLTLACISAERHQAIAQPFKTTQRRRRIMVLVPLTWVLAIAVAGFCQVFVKDSPVYVRCAGRKGRESYDTFGLYILFPLWAACFAVILGFYVSIFLLVRSHNRKIFDKGVHHSKTDKGDSSRGNGEAANGSDNSGQKQTLRESVGQVEAETPAQADSAGKGYPATLVTAAEAPQCVPHGSDGKKHLKKRLEITDLEGEGPPLTRASTQSEEKTFKPEKLTSPAKKVEAPRTKEDAAAGRKSSSTNPQKVSGISDTETPSKERVQIDKTPSEMKERSPRGPSSAHLPNPEPNLLMQPEGTKQSSSGEPSPAAPEEPPPPPASTNVPETEAPKQNADVEGPVCMMPSKERKERASKHKESKLAKRAGYIIITFLVFWLPLVATILVNLVSQESQNLQNTRVQDVEILSVSVACITSLSDPIIYAAVNPQFRTEFSKLKNGAGSIFKRK